jgi:hypothetical protein
VGVTYRCSALTELARSRVLSEAKGSRCLSDSSPRRLLAFAATGAGFKVEIEIKDFNDSHRAQAQADTHKHLGLNY